MTNQDRLIKKLLSIGGEVANVDNDEELNKLLNRGKLFNNKVMKYVGTPGQCHKNSTDLWEQNKDRLRVCTGYALCRHPRTKKMTLICHSWCYDKLTDKIVETNPARYNDYFGFKMMNKEAEEFIRVVWY